MQIKALPLLAAALSAQQANGALTAQLVVRNINEITTVSGNTAEIATKVTPFSAIYLIPQVIKNFSQIVQLVVSDIAMLAGATNINVSGGATGTTVSGSSGGADGSGSITVVNGKPGNSGSSSGSSGGSVGVSGSIGSSGGSSSGSSGSSSTTSGSAMFSQGDQLSICDAFTDFVKVHQNLLSIVIGKAGFLSGTPFTAPIALVLRTIEGGVDKFAFTLIGLIPTCADQAMMDKAKLDNTLTIAIKKFS